MKALDDFDKYIWSDGSWCYVKDYGSVTENGFYILGDLASARIERVK